MEKITLWEAIETRHSVRSYTDRRIEGQVKEELLTAVKKCNHESGLHMQLILDEPKAFGGIMAHYGKFSGVNNYIAVVGKKSPQLEESCGYYGERLVLFAQRLGLNTCWVALTYKKIPEALKIGKGEKLVAVIAVGYGENKGVPHKSKPMAGVCSVSGMMPEWFRKGMEAALLAPTAMNQQKFFFSLDGNRVSAKAGRGFYTKLDLGIVKYHFTIGAGNQNFTWA